MKKYTQFCFIMYSLMNILYGSTGPFYQEDQFDICALEYKPEIVEQQRLMPQPRRPRDLRLWNAADRSGKERALLVKVAEQKEKIVDGIGSKEDVKSYVWDEKFDSISSAMYGRLHCQSPLFVPRSDSVETLPDGPNRSGAKNPSPQELVLEDIEAK